MKKITALLLAVLMICAFAACGQTAAGPDVIQMKAICELATKECYFHNVAKCPAEKGFLGIETKSELWIEYDGTVKLGIDASLVSIEVNDTQVTITISKAKVLSCKTDLSKAIYIWDKGLFNPTGGGEDEVSALAAAESALKAAAESNTMLLNEAQTRAQILLEEYVENIGDVTGINYTVRWVYLDADGDPAGAADETPTEQTEDPAA